MDERKYEWNDAAKVLPPVDEAVIVYQLALGRTFAAWAGSEWVAVDFCGNRGYLAWTPEFWRRNYIPPDPVKQ